MRAKLCWYCSSVSFELTFSALTPAAELGVNAVGFRHPASDDQIRLFGDDGFGGEIAVEADGRRVFIGGVAVELVDADDFFIRAEFRGDVGNVGGQDNDTLRGGMGGKQGQDGGEDVFFHDVSVWFAGFGGRLKT